MAKKILIIDDEPDVVKMMLYRLKAKGYDVVTANDGARGVLEAKRTRPDAVVLDYCLPDMRALDVANGIREDRYLKDVPIVLVTASIEDIRNKAEECGADEYVSKPVDPQELCVKLEKCVNGR
jgi:DNA-binding response OmpR family regulator